MEQKKKKKDVVARRWLANECFKILLSLSLLLLINSWAAKQPVTNVFRVRDDYINNPQKPRRRMVDFSELIKY